MGVGSTGEYTGEETTVGIAPLLSYDTERLHVGLDGIHFDVLEFQQGHVAVALRYRGAPAFPQDTPLFEGLEREGTVEVGIRLEWEFGNAYMSIDGMTDVMDTHGGTEANVALGYTVALGAFVIGSEVGARFRDAKLNQFLYGVLPAEANSIRPEYAAKVTTTAFAGINARYPITHNISTVGLIEYEDLGSNTRSPLVDKTEVINLGLGLAMSF